MILVLVGPTAVGKSALAVALANQYNGEIISGDSVQIYRELNIGSAKPTLEDQDGIIHHLIDAYEIGQPYSVADFQREVRLKIQEILAKNKTVILCGGTGFYVKAALYDYVFDHAARDHTYEATLDDESNDSLYAMLQGIDPQTAMKFHPNNRIRILRALGYHQANQQRLSSQTNKDHALYEFIGIGLTMERARLYERINQRVDAMLEAGLLEEVRGLIKKQDQIQAIGYNELFEVEAGQRSLADAVALIKQRSRQLAKRQFTWFRHQMNLHWIDVTSMSLEDTVQQAVRIIESQNKLR